MKKTYVVMGSEDGIQGVFGNIKKAYESASDYCEMNGGAVLTYSQVCKEISTRHSSYIESKDGYGNATISLHYLNAM